MSFKVSNVHLEVLCAFMENHRDLAVGKLNAPSARDSHKKLWAVLANSLNAEGLGYRSVKKWQKTWTDFKYNLKRKVSVMKKEITETGGEPARNIYANNIMLSRFEKRILAIMGPGFYKGIGQPKKRAAGFKVGSSNPTSSGIKTSNLISHTTSNTSSPTASPKAIVSTSDMEEVMEEETPAVSGVNEDHEYIIIDVQQPNTRKRKRTAEEIIRLETVEVLRSLNNSVMILNSQIPNLTNAINRLADVRSRSHVKSEEYDEEF